MNRKTNTGYKNISKRVRKGRKDKYEARFNYNGTTTYIGNFDTLNEAVTARKKFITSLI